MGETLSRLVLDSGYRAEGRRHSTGEDERWMLVSIDSNGAAKFTEEIVSENTAPPEDVCRAQPEVILSEDTSPPEESGCRAQLESAPDPAIVTNELGPGDEIGQGETDGHKEQVPPSQETDILQLTPRKTSQQMLESASDPAIATDRIDPGDETGHWGRDEVQVLPSHRTIMLQGTPDVTPQHDIDDQRLPVSEPAIVTDGLPVDLGAETGQGKRDEDEEQIPPGQETDLLQTTSPHHNVDAGSDLTSIRPQTTNPKAAKAVAAKHALQTHSYSLSKRIKSASGLASGLLSKKIIDFEDNERASKEVYGTERERVHTLLIKVIQQLERKPHYLEILCDILKKEGVSSKELKRDYQCKYDELTQDSAGQTEQDLLGVVGATATTGAVPLEVQTSDSETDSEVDSDSPSVETQVLNIEKILLGREPYQKSAIEKFHHDLTRKGPAFLQQACRSGSSMTVQHILINSKQFYGTILTDNDETLMHLALDHGHCNVFNVLCSHLADTESDVNAQDKKGRTLLHVACLASTHLDPENPVQKQMHEVVIPCLLESGAQADIKDEDGETPLHLACQKSDAAIAEMLLKHSAECTMINNKLGDTPLHIASSKGASDIVDVLLKHNASPCAQNKDEFTPLHLACLQANVHIAEVLVMCDPSTLDMLDKDGQTPLHLACLKSDARTAEMLLRHSTTCLRARNKLKDKDTALHIACREGALDVVDVLLKYKADGHVQNKNGYTPLHLASLNGYEEVARRLVNYDHSTVDGIDQNQNTPLHLACQKTVTEATLVVTLLNKRIDKYNSEGFTTLHLASSCGNVAVVKQLLKHCRTDSFVNCQNKKDGDTALHLACQNGFEKVVSLLLKPKYKAKSDRRNFANKTPIDVARENQHKTVVQLCLHSTTKFLQKLRKAH